MKVMVKNLEQEIAKAVAENKDFEGWFIRYNCKDDVVELDGYEDAVSAEIEDMDADRTNGYWIYCGHVDEQNVTPDVIVAHINDAIREVQDEVGMDVYEYCKQFMPEAFEDFPECQPDFDVFADDDNEGGN